MGFNLWQRTSWFSSVSSHLVFNSSSPRMKKNTGLPKSQQQWAPLPLEHCQWPSWRCSPAPGTGSPATPFDLQLFQLLTIVQYMFTNVLFFFSSRKFSNFQLSNQKVAYPKTIGCVTSYIEYHQIRRPKRVVMNQSHLGQLRGELWRKSTRQWWTVQLSGKPYHIDYDEKKYKKSVST